MTQFHEGQEVEVTHEHLGILTPSSKAKIHCHSRIHEGKLWVEFPNGTRAVLDTDHIRAIVRDDWYSEPKVHWGDQL